MGHTFQPDDFTEADVMACLDRAGLKWKDGHRYILTQCPMPDHDDKNPSAQIFKNDWFVNCLGPCGRFHITKAFPELKPWKPGRYAKQHKEQVNYQEFNLYYEWLNLPNIPRDHTFKGIPLEILDGLGWRYTDGSLGMGVGYFIPYFDQTKGDNGELPFAQVRHLEGERRFTFLKDARPNIYGAWNLLAAKRLFIVEGASDCATLQYVGIPWVGLPSASSGELIRELGLHANDNGIRLIYAGDNDEAGDKLRAALDEVAHYRVCQPPKEYKDWNDFFQAAGYEAVSDYAMKGLTE